MNVEIGTETPIFLFWEYLFRNFDILSLQCATSQARRLHVVPGQTSMYVGQWLKWWRRQRNISPSVFPHSYLAPCCSVSRALSPTWRSVVFLRPILPEIRVFHHGQRYRLPPSLCSWMLEKRSRWVITPCLLWEVYFVFNASLSIDFWYKSLHWAIIFLFLSLSLVLRKFLASVKGRIF